MAAKIYDAIVIGGGHAGVEAAFILSKKNFNVALISLNQNRLASMPCNPSIGGPAKGIITREIDALGGKQAYFADQAMIQIKMLNTSKGPAVRAIRAQIDKEKYSQIILKAVQETKNIDLIEDMVFEIQTKDNKISGVITEKNGLLETKTAIITAGTYLDSYILRGEEKYSSGPDGEKTSNSLSNSLIKLGFKLLRLKTGTPPRIYANSIDFSEVEEEILPESNLNFSIYHSKKLSKQIHCYLTYTSEKTHQIILDNINKSSMYSGLIKGIGPRYCPSVEDKIVRFKDKERHQIFFEPETIKADIMYINGLSTSMPIDVQDQMIKSINGLKNAKVAKYAYAIEYDAIDPLQLKKSLESKEIENLFFAGQINGTSGYEEAAGQGLLAGINASLKLENREALNLKRSDSYIGVLIDDLTTKGTKEPYRMLTSRAEYRLLLRNDNADIRLLKYAKYAKTLTDKEIATTEAKYDLITKKIAELENQYISINDPLAKKYNLANSTSFLQLISRHEIDIKEIVGNFPFLEELSTNVRLDGYIKKQLSQADKMLRLENLKLPEDLNYDNVVNLAFEARQKLKMIKPLTIGQASRISGINPADIQMLMFHLNLKVVKNEN
ncbi:tRNA uridine-5-carboxymethylaminomethyl(34) synthesis enzyme MnmG [[Mycoplasma] mobile]|uniref:tRNA uridine 5-carboxymethylaminomethyl modification enzyme MnmG n=1 Tax=Mycoplasma mobile (strain ATCC 43663 / 163K / NCTC 11711) TaxID=267748 RepID=MNMG_MYCM1|nr:tRNA uridine-5-carboxymethylaminomethyl(34) synthesis enzyme MnmG [[Mycoplasma] mobile]Q6KID6.1 RecName: Full=tRNA uridine 5-carboxymethylaminomethyl modification enzyme MnmG; AltName: Full=Glucose-inhibited division protein A [Mycoplasma mobile 163K]AAT27640.1 glucose inhibited division protein a [Mycoplasma mobile 163K]